MNDSIWKKLTYLSSVYSLGNASIEKKQARYKKVCQVAAKMLSEGKYVFSPILHNHPINLETNFKLTRDNFWLGFDLNILSRCNELVIVEMQGWKSSVGIREEAQFALKKGMKIYLTKNGIDFHELEKPPKKWEI